MSTSSRVGYHFATKAQWGACLTRGVELVEADGVATVQPFAAFAPPQRPTWAVAGAAAPAVTRAHETLWRDGAGTLYRLADGDEVPRTSAAPASVRASTRLVTSGDALWTAAGEHRVESFDAETLTRRLVVPLPEARVVDLASDGHGGVLVLAQHADGWSALPIDHAGRFGTEIPLAEVSELEAITYLWRSGRIVVLAAERTRAFAFTIEGGAPDARLTLATLGPCFVGTQIASDRHGRVLVAGTVREGGIHQNRIVLMDGYGAKLADVVVPEPVTGIAADGDRLVITGASGVFVVPAVATVPDAVTEIDGAILTPMLEGPNTADGRRWLRVEAAAKLPVGTALAIAYAATDDPRVRDEMLALTRDATIARTRRGQLLRQVADVWSPAIVFHGSETPAVDGGPLALPLHDVRGRYLWVAVSLIANAGATQPSLTRLSVLYPGRTLMEQLPAIYQRDESVPGSFVRSLVGVLETTTQDLDARIASLGRYIHPEHAPGPWLDYVARWLGLSWDDALTVKQKRCLVRHADQLARGRGTRVGLETFLTCIAPGTPRRFRVTDVTADYGFATLGGDGCLGSPLPAVLGGATRPRAELDAGFALGAVRLPCADAVDAGDWPRPGRIRVDVAATAGERRDWEPWLAALIDDVLPLTARAELHWVSAAALRPPGLDGELELGGAPEPHLGTDAVTGVARLPEHLSNLSDSGPPTGLRLQ